MCACVSVSLQYCKKVTLLHIHSQTGMLRKNMVKNLPQITQLEVRELSNVQTPVLPTPYSIFTKELSR